MHKLKKIVVAMSLIAPVSAYSLGVGELKLNSALNESLNAEIPLALSANENINDISITIASPEKFDEAGISWHYFLSGIRFNKVSKGNNSYIVELTSNNIVQEPFLDFLIEVKWPNGNIFKSFTVLVDPAIENQNNFIEPTQAPLKQPNRVVTQVKKEPELVIENDFSSLAIEGEYGPTQRNDSLWKIAESINGNQGQSVEQVMMALYKANPRAFYKKNVNALMAGKTLKIPSNADINSLSKEQASTEFYFQHDVWTGKRKAASKPRAVIANDEKQGKKLTLVSPVKEELKEPEALVANAGKQQKLANKNEALQERLALLEEKFSVMQKMLEIKDKELAALQDARFAAELDAIEKLAKEKVEKETQKSAPLVKDKVAVQKPKVEAKLKSAPKTESKPKQVQPTAEVIEESVSYLNIMLGLLVILLVAIGGFFSWRKRQAEPEDEVENIFKATDHSDLTDKLESTIEGQAALSTANESSFNAEVEHPKVKEELMDDVLLDADTYLAYGKYDEAEKSLRHELSLSPDKDSYKLKLLEVFYSSENNEAFDIFVQELIQDGKRSDTIFWGNVSAMGQDFSTHPDLFSDDVIRDDNPEFDLNIDEPVDEPIDVSEVLELPISELNTLDGNKEEAVTEFEFDNAARVEEKVSLEPEKLDIESFEFTPSVVDKIDMVDSTAEKDEVPESLEMISFPSDTAEKETIEQVSTVEVEELDSIDMELGDADLSIEEMSIDISSDENEDLLSLDSEPGIDLTEFDLSDELVLDDELKSDSSSESQELDDKAPVEADDDKFDDFDFDFSVEGDASYTPPVAVDEGELSLSDDEQKLSLDPSVIAEINDTGDYETNLDLAKMYVAMGETDAAKELAEDVLANGSEVQKKEAQEVLDHISAL